MSIWFERNGITGTTETAPAGHVVYVVTAANGATMRTDVGSLARSVAIEWSVCPPPAPQMASPLPAAERCTSGLATGATLTMPTEPQARIMSEAADWWAGTVRRGRHCPETATTGLRNMRAMARRGWLELDDPIRPTYGTLTDAGRRALARYNAATAGAR